MGAEGHCHHEAAARHYELAAQHHRLAAERAAGGDIDAAAQLAQVANVYAVRGHRYALRASVPSQKAMVDVDDPSDDEASP